MTKSHLPPRPERRRERRIAPKGAAVLRAGTYSLRGRIANLSRTGLAMTTPTTAPGRLLGARVDISLRLDGGDSSWMELSGEILRIGANSLAMALVTVLPAFTRIVDESTVSSQRNDRMLSIVLVDASSQRRSAMADGFRAAGCTVLEVTTALEAIVRLGESEFEPDLIAVADSQPASISDEIRRFVEVDHPRARLVTIGDAASAPEGLQRWLSSANPNEDLEARIRAVLTTFGA